ncbi:MAG: GTP cyclohydrolase II [Planctomycetes bacterium]|nr:GTP cyclohydrolase II [Planctomycetota bacterium]
MAEKSFATIEEAVEAISRGGIVIVVDDEDRENEGDFICAAETLTPEIVNFMLSRGRGMFCVPLLPERAEQLDLQSATARNTALQSTAFTVTCDLKTLKTGISAHERTKTARALADPSTGPGDLARPGHVQPIVAMEGGVLRRAGHTEATVDLCRLAGLQPVGVLIEILDDNGEMARRDRLFEIAAEHDLPIITIEELIRYRMSNEKLVERLSSCDLPTRFGHFQLHLYHVRHETQDPVALVMGDLSQSKAPLVRMHSACLTGDLLDSLRCDCGSQLRMAMEMIQREGVGVLVYLFQEGRGIGLSEKLKAYGLQDEGMDTVEANLALGHQVDVRDYGIGIQILKDLGLQRVRLLTNNPKKLNAFIRYGYGLDVVDQVPILAPPNRYNERYLRTKKLKMGHQIPFDDDPLEV